MCSGEVLEWLKKHEGFYPPEEIAKNLNKSEMAVKRQLLLEFRQQKVTFVEVGVYGKRVWGCRVREIA